MLLTLLIVFSLLFAITHIGLCHGKVRAGLVAKLGPMRFRLLYSLVAIGTFTPAAVIFFTERHLGPVLYELPRWAELLIALPCTFFAVQLLVLSMANPSPASMIPAKPEARGVLRITRHPMNMGWTLFGIAHLAGNGFLGDIVFWGLCFVFVGLVGAFHLDRRKRRSAGESHAAFYRETSVLPFAAIVMRRQKLDLSDLALPMVAIALIAWGALVYFHGSIFGVGLL
jgi:uncharacterized membrane protein